MLFKLGGEEVIFKKNLKNDKGKKCVMNGMKK